MGELAKENVRWEELLNCPATFNCPANSPAPKPFSFRIVAMSLCTLSRCGLFSCFRIVWSTRGDHFKHFPTTIVLSARSAGGGGGNCGVVRGMEKQTGRWSLSGRSIIFCLLKHQPREWKIYNQ